MTTIRVGKRDRYTTVSRSTINDAKLSFRARGVLFWLLDKPDDWHTTSESIASAGIEGRDAIRSALKELEACAYLVRRKWRTGSGEWQAEWIVREVPKGLERKTSAGQPLRETSPLTEELKQITDSRDATLKLKADPDCISCRGEGHHYSAAATTPDGAGRDIACFCTYRSELPEREESA